MRAYCSKVQALAGGYDETGFFGIADIRTREDIAYTATFIYDTKKGDPSGSTADQDRRDGGAYTGTDSPILQATFSINGFTTDMTYVGEGLVQTNAFGLHYANSNDLHDTAAEKLQAALYMFGQGAPANLLTAPLDTAITQGYGNAYIHRLDKTLGTYTQDAAFTLNPTHLTVTVLEPDSTVPEPAMWGMLLAGFGLVGATMRKQRALTA